MPGRGCQDQSHRRLQLGIVGGPDLHLGRHLQRWAQSSQPTYV
jgi:hypothetical protein